MNSIIIYKLMDDMKMKQKTVFVCDECGYETVKYFGKCPSCSQFATLKEFKIKPDNKKTSLVNVGINKMVQNINDIQIGTEIRFKSGISELDRVLGGGAVLGSFVLVGGEPGIGKSTLLLQMCQKMSSDIKILYVSGEESLGQIKLRANRLGFDNNNLLLFAETELGEIINQVNKEKPQVLIIDSIQTTYNGQTQAAPGNVTQIKECAMELMLYAKNFNTTVFIVGHVNKDGMVAGPKMLEHMVDCVLYFEGDRHISYRMLRAEKNRYGSTNEIGVFEMTDKGLKEIPNPSAILLSGHLTGSIGNCISASMEGTRPILAEVQALITKTSFPAPRRAGVGVDYNRMVLLLAILEKRVGMFMSSNDAYINVIGGLKLDEPAVDLSIILAIASSYKSVPVKEGLVAFGEVGLTGELRAVSSVAQRINEASRMGFNICIIPVQDMKDINIPDNMEVIKVSNIAQAIKYALN